MVTGKQNWMKNSHVCGAACHARILAPFSIKSHTGYVWGASKQAQVVIRFYTDLALVWFPPSSQLLIIFLFCRWMQALQRFSQSMLALQRFKTVVDLEEERGVGVAALWLWRARWDEQLPPRLLKFVDAAVGQVRKIPQQPSNGFPKNDRKVQTSIVIQQVHS